MHAEDDGRASDLAGIHALCVARSYMGKSITEVFSYAELWADLVIGPYEKFAPQLIWVAEEIGSGEITGYLTGAIDQDFYLHQENYLDETVERLRQQSLRDLFSNPVKLWGDTLSLIAGLDQRTLTFLQYLRTEAHKELPRRPNTPHFNVFAGYDGCGIARALIGAFMAELKKRDIAGYHINALYVPEEEERKALEGDGFRVRSRDFFEPRYRLYDALETRIFQPYKLMLGVFESRVR